MGFKVELRRTTMETAAMRKAKYTEEQMVKILREADKAPVAEVAKKHGMSGETIYAWRRRFTGCGREFVAGSRTESEAGSF